MLTPTIDSSDDHLHKFSLNNGDAQLSYSEVIEGWSSNQQFREEFTAILTSSPFDGFRWETPALSTHTMDDPFEFVLINADRFCSRRTDANTFRDYFTDDDTDLGVVTFPSLGRDSTLVVPSPRTESDAYGHLAAFLRLAPAEQIDALWRVVGREVQQRVSDKPIWLNTEGGGVAWLHVRIDSRPKYYGYAPYKTP